MGPIRCPFATPIWGQAGKTHIGPTWKTTLGPSGTHLGVLAGKANGDQSVLNNPQTDTKDDHPILCREVEAAVQSLKKGKSAGVDNIPAELVQTGGEDVITVLTTIYDKIWQTEEWPTPWTQSLSLIHI